MQKLLEGLGWVEGEPGKRVWRRHDDPAPLPVRLPQREPTGQEGYGPVGIHVWEYNYSSGLQRKLQGQ